MQNKKSKGRGNFVFPWYTALFYLLLYLWEPRGGTAATLLSALLHELGHYAAARVLGVRVERITVYPFGADMKLGGGLRSYGTDMVIAASGAAVNLLLAGLGLLLGRTAWVACNVLLALVNLLPVEGLDGGVILLAAVERRGGRGTRALKISSFICLFFLWLMAVYILLVSDGDPSLFVLSCGLFVSIFLRRDGKERFRGKSE